MTTTPDPSDRTPTQRSGPPARKTGLADLAGLAAAVRSIERGENPAAPAPRGDAAAARRKRKEAMAAEAEAFQAAEAAEAAGLPVPPGAPADASAATGGVPRQAEAGGEDAAEEVNGPTRDGGSGRSEADPGHDADSGAQPAPSDQPNHSGDHPTADAPAESAPSDDRAATGRTADERGAGNSPVGSAPSNGRRGEDRDGNAAARDAGNSPAGPAPSDGRPIDEDDHAATGRTPGERGTGNSPAGPAPSESAGRHGQGADGPAPTGGMTAARGAGEGTAGPASSGSRHGEDTDGHAAAGRTPDARGAGETGAGEAPSERGPRRVGDGPVGAGGSGRSGAGAGGAGVSVGLGGAQGGAGGRGEVDPAAVEAAGKVLAQGGAPAELAVAAVRALGEGAAGELREDPWLVLGFEGVRVGVEQVDAFARAVLGAACGPGDERRVRALVGHVMERAAEAGHTALTAEALGAALARHAVPDPADALASAVEEGQLLVFGGESEDGPFDGEEDGDGEPAQAAGPVLVALDRYALAEESLADGCVRLLRSIEVADGWAGVDWEGTAAAAPSPSAAELIRAVAAHALVLHTGGEAARAEPTALVAAARAAGLRAYAAAYTENGRRRLAADLGEEAALTVAGLLAGGRAPDGSLPVDLVAVLDAPQLSVEEAATLVEAVPDGARLVLSGDPYALWSAGPGRAFADLLAAKACPKVTSRTPDPGPIGELISCVGEGELARVDAPDKEVVVVPAHDPGEAVHRAVQLVADSVPRAFGLAPERVQVVTTAHGGPAGTRALNAALKERLNPGPGRFAGFDPGDRVVHVPAPGRAYPGTVAGAEPDGLRLECESGPVLVPREEVAATVRHGWALTCHQAAGMRWPAVVVVVPGDAGPLLSRSWVYTAFGRGERHLSVVQGADQGLAQAVAGPQAAPRTTRLAAILTDAP